MTEPRIIQPVTVGGNPGGPDGTPAPVEGQQIAVSADPRQEYVSATGTIFYGNYLRSLQWSFDDVTQEFGDDLYDRMLRDPQIIACVNVLKTAILEDGVQLMACEAEEGSPDAERAREIADLCTQMLDNLRPSLDDTLWNMLDGLALGNKVAEIVYDYDATNQLTIRAVKVKPRNSVAFVVDVFYNVIGLLARIPGVGMPVQGGTFLIGSLTDQFNILPREKFAVFSFRPKDNDPRGTSILRPAYNAWWLKMQTWPQYLKFLVQFGTPSLIGTVAPNSNTYTPPGGTQQTPEQLMVQTLIQIQNGSVAALPAGSEVKPLELAGGGIAAFDQAFAMYNREMTTAILHQTLATMESQHQTRAAAGVHRGVLDTIVRQGKKSVARMIRNDILRPFLRFRFGPDAERLAPHVTLGSAEQGDLQGLWTAAAALMRANYFSPDQMPGVDELLNLPPRALVPEPVVDDVTVEEDDDAAEQP